MKLLIQYSVMLVAISSNLCLDHRNINILQETTWVSGVEFTFPLKELQYIPCLDGRFHGHIKTGTGEIVPSTRTPHSLIENSVFTPLTTFQQ